MGVAKGVLTAMASTLEAVRALAPLIREHADLIEAERCLPPPIVEALTEAGYRVVEADSGEAALLASTSDRRLSSSSMSAYPS